MAYDPDDQYVVPFGWGVFGIGVNKRAFGGKNPAASWSLLFDPAVFSGSVTMMDDARELVSIAAHYLFGAVDRLSKDQINEIQRLLCRQKPRVALYTDLRADYTLISQTAPVVVAMSSDMSKIVREYDYVDFLLPQEGTFIVVDVFAIPATASHDDFIYRFLNYIFSPKILQKYVDKHGFLPTLKTVDSHSPFIFAIPTQEQFSKFSLFRNSIIDEEDLNNIWISLKT